jgi:hypothetical protein
VRQPPRRGGAQPADNKVGPRKPRRQHYKVAEEIGTGQTGVAPVPCAAGKHNKCKLSAGQRMGAVDLNSDGKRPPSQGWRATRATARPRRYQRHEAGQAPLNPAQTLLNPRQRRESHRLLFTLLHRLLVPGGLGCGPRGLGCVPLLVGFLQEVYQLAKIDGAATISLL